MSEVGGAPAAGEGRGDPQAPDAAARVGSARGLWGDAWRRLRRNRVVLMAAGFILLIAVVAVFGPFLSPYADDTLDWQHMAVGPGTLASHWFGTDRLGRDLFVRTLHGVRISLVISLLASGVSLVIGVTLGFIAGSLGG